MGKRRLQGVCLGQHAADLGEKRGLITGTQGVIEGASIIRGHGFLSVLARAQALPSHVPCSGGRTLGEAAGGSESCLRPSLLGTSPAASPGTSSPCGLSVPSFELV